VLLEIFKPRGMVMRIRDHRLHGHGAPAFRRVYSLGDAAT
jgi:hypothetical protein